MNGYIDLIKSCGYRVFIRPDPRSVNNVTYCFYTDGVKIGYAQWDTFRQYVSTVHCPNKVTGTGFQFSNEITPETVTGALECFAPGWANRAEEKSILKYADWSAYFNSSPWNKELAEV